MNYSLNCSKRFLIRNVCTKHIRRHQSESSSQYCLKSIKTHDYDNFICTLLLQNTVRSCAIAVRAFNVEVSKVSEQVSQNNIGLMRLKFWEETVSKCYADDAKIPQHPVALELYKAIKTAKLTKRYLNTLVSSRVNSLGRTSFSTLDEMEKYVEQSVSSIYYLLLESSGVKNVNADHAASHLGKAQGIIQHLRCTPLASKINIIPLPQELLIKHKITEEEIIRGTASERLSECSFEMASRAYQHLTKARSLLNSVPVEGRAVLLPAIIVGNYLDRLQKVHHNVLDKNLQHRSWTWLPKLWWSSYKKKY